MSPDKGLRQCYEPNLSAACQGVLAVFLPLESICPSLNDNGLLHLQQAISYSAIVLVLLIPVLVVLVVLVILIVLVVLILLILLILLVIHDCFLQIICTADLPRL